MNMQLKTRCSLYGHGSTHYVSIDIQKLRTYVTFKITYSTGKYVLMNLKRNERSFIAQFRCGIPPLCVETGWYIDEKSEECVCKICNDNKLKI